MSLPAGSFSRGGGSGGGTFSPGGIGAGFVRGGRGRANGDRGGGGFSRGGGGDRGGRGGDSRGGRGGSSFSRGGGDRGRGGAPSFSRGGSDRGGFSRGGGDRGGGFSRGGGDRGGGFSRGGGDRGGRGASDRGGFRGGRGAAAPRGGGGTWENSNTKKKFKDSDGEESSDDGDRPNAAADDDDESEDEVAVAATTTDADGTEMPNPKNKSRRDNMQTELTEDGTELPARLNNRIFIDGLPYQEPGGDNTIMDALYNFCDQWKVGKVVNLIKKPGQGFGYLVFRSPHSVQAAVNVLNDRKFMGRQLRVQIPKERGADGMVVGEAKEKSDKLGLTTYTRQVLLSDLSVKANPEVLTEVLRELSSELAEKIEKIKMAGRGRKAFITFTDESDVDEAVALLNGFSLLGRMVCAVKAQAPGTLAYSKVTLGNRTLHANNPELDAEGNPIHATIAAAGAAAAGGLTATGATKKSLTGSKFDYQDQGADEILVGNLPDQATVEQLKSHFSSAGRIVDVEILLNEHTRQSSGIAKLRFAIPGQAKYAKQHLDGSQLGGAVLRVDRGDESSAVAGVGAPVGNGDDDEEEDDIDEDAFLKHMGVSDKKEYFRGLPKGLGDGPVEENAFSEEEPARKRRRTETGGKGGASGGASDKKFGSVKSHVKGKAAKKPKF